MWSQSPAGAGAGAGGGAFAGTLGILFLFLKYANNVQIAATQSWRFHPPEPFGGWPFPTELDVPSKGTGSFGTRRRWVPTLSFFEVKCGRARKVYCEGSKVRSL